MCQFLIIFAVVFFHGTAIQGQTSALMQEEMFCDYVGMFAKQIARNKVRGLPFSRIDEFDYFDNEQGAFLSDTAQEIYQLDPEILRTTLDIISREKLEDCSRVFVSD